MEPITATVSVNMKVNLGNYESADGFARIAYDRLKVHLGERIKALREKR